MVSRRRTVGVKGAMVPADSSVWVLATKRVAVCFVLLVLYHDETLPFGPPPETFERSRSLAQCPACRQLVNCITCRRAADLIRAVCAVMSSESVENEWIKFLCSCSTEPRGAARWMTTIFQGFLRRSVRLVWCDRREEGHMTRYTAQFTRNLLTLPHPNRPTVDFRRGSGTF